MNKEMVVFFNFKLSISCEVTRKHATLLFFSFLIHSLKNETFKLEQQNFHLIAWNEYIFLFFFVFFFETFVFFYLLKPSKSYSS